MGVLRGGGKVGIRRRTGKDVPFVYEFLARGKLSYRRIASSLRLWLLSRSEDSWRFLVKSLVPLVFSVYGKVDFDFDDVCSDFFLKVRKVFIQKEGYFYCKDVFLVRLLYLIACACVRKREGKYGNFIPGCFFRLIERRMRESVVGLANLSLALEEFPDLVLRRAMAHDRFGYGEVVLREAIQFYLEDGVDWGVFGRDFSVRDLDHLQRFTRLMVQWTERDCFGSECFCRD